MPKEAPVPAVGQGPFARGILDETRPRSRPRAILRGIVIAIIATHIVLALWSGYRAIWQVFALEIRAPAVLRAGDAVSYSVVSSGRVPVTVWLELIQGARGETLATTVVEDGVIAVYDPRIRRGRWSGTLSADQLAPFEPGLATLRVTATGRPQFLRSPPPTVREMAVRIDR